MENSNYAGHLHILETEEIAHIYSVPDFTPDERAVFFMLTTPEREQVNLLRGTSSKVYFILQLGYFKAKHLFFTFDFEDQVVDTAFVLTKYFPDKEKEELTNISRPTRQNQQQLICNLFGYHTFDAVFQQQLIQKAAVLAKRHNHAVYLFRSLLQYFHTQKVIIPAYSFLQREIVSLAIREEQLRLEQFIENNMSDADKNLVNELLEKPKDDMHPFTLQQKEPSSFDYYQIRRLLLRQQQLKPIFEVAKKLCIQMEIANENIRYYSSMATEQKVFNLKRLQGSNSNMLYIYLLCFTHNRYRQVNDILAEALKFYVLGLEKSAEKAAQTEIYNHQLASNEALDKVPNILAFFRNDQRDKMLFSEVKRAAFSILTPEEFDLVIDFIKKSKPDKKVLIWMYYQIKKRLISLYLRPLCFHFSFDNNSKSDNLMEAIDFLKEELVTNKKLPTKIETKDLPCDFLAKNGRKFIKDKDGNVQLAKYEMALYQALRNKLEAGDVFIPDSFINKDLDDDLIPKEEWTVNKPTIIKKLDAPKILKSAAEVLEEWRGIIEPLYKRTNQRIKKGLNPSVQIDGKHKDGSTKWHLIYTETSNPLNHQIYRQFAPIDIASLLKLVDNHTNFLAVFTHLFGSKVNRNTDKDKLIACIVAFGTNYGIGKMASISDMSYQDLASTANTLIYLDTLRAANRRIINKLKKLPMYKHYQMQPGVVHSSSDGQKYYTQIPTINSRYSPKYFGTEKGVSSITNVADNVLVNGDIIGANEYEGNYVFDLVYNNNSDIQTDIHSTDSHGINQVNFAILDMFGYQFAPRYKDISSKAKTIYSFHQPSKYKDYLLQSKRILKENLIIEEWDNFQRILASLGMKTTTQSTIIKKLSSTKRNNKTKRAIAEYDNIVETYHKLRYIDDPVYQKQINTVLNRGEHVNKLRKHLFHADGGRFKVHTVMEQKIWMECNRLIANDIVYYNTWLLSELLAYHESQGNVMEADLIKKVSPIAWQHIHIYGRYIFRVGKVVWDVAAMVRKVKL